jgi:hypothetical protein
MRRAESIGSISDLDESIAAQRLAITADAEPEGLAGRLANLATACVDHFGISGEVAKLDEAEGYYKEILALAPSKGAGLDARLGPQAKISRCTRSELHALLRVIASELPRLPEHSTKLRVVHFNLRNIRISLARPDFRPR